MYNTCVTWEELIMKLRSEWVIRSEWVKRALRKLLKIAGVDGSTSGVRGRHTALAAVMVDSRPKTGPRLRLARRSQNQNPATADKRYISTASARRRFGTNGAVVFAGIAQWQSVGFVSRRFRVRVPVPALCVPSFLGSFFQGYAELLSFWRLGKTRSAAGSSWHCSRRREHIPA